VDLLDKSTLYLTDHTGQFLLVALAASVVAIILTVGFLLRIRPLMRPFAKIKDSSQRPEEMLSAALRQLEENRLGIGELSRSVRGLVEENRSFFGYVALVKYDAFEDVGGQQSYSLCLLNSERDGFLITNLTGRNSVRSYAVGIHSGKAARKLSDEERGALEEALSQRSGMQSN
jgi:hypothetical protein